ncbi:MAG: flavodoxin domain-containing protein [Clostridia bacterium]
MSTIVIYKSKYGATKIYAKWISQELNCKAVDAKSVKIDDLKDYDTIIFGGGLYAEMIAGISLITKNIDKLKGKKLIVYTTGLTPVTCREYYDKLIMDRNFKDMDLSNIKVYNFLGKMVVDELSLPHKMAIKALKKMMANKENPTDMEKLLIELCDTDGDFTDKEAIKDLVEYARA